MGTLLYLATGEGVVTVKSNGKDTWEAEQKGLSSWDINEIAVEQSAPARVYAGTRGDGVWRSDDFGDTSTQPDKDTARAGSVAGVTQHSASVAEVSAAEESAANRVGSGNNPTADRFSRRRLDDHQSEQHHDFNHAVNRI